MHVMDVMDECGVDYNYVRSDKGWRGKKNRGD